MAARVFAVVLLMTCVFADTANASCSDSPRVNQTYTGVSLGSAVGTSSTSTCCSLCSASGAAGYSFDTNSYQCQCYQRVGPLSTAPGVYSGYISGDCYNPSFVPDMDFSGSYPYSTGASSAHDCYEKCKSSSDCCAFSYISGTCKMRDTVDEVVQTVPNTGCISGTVEVSACTYSGSCQYFPGADAAGNVFNSSVTTSLHDCCSACKGNSKCDSWTFTASTGICVFKSDASNMVDAADSSTGYT
eukprot:TRINITY_DN174_c0_g1_i3.p1 TRINITY_DN174_c0_g1~~TRINITY_DN174_c0_g1_i3.p1  ORF type:complete len:244 (-),score=7.40 TRINITY_DN174_c0_g1_i3:450-1181(-)